MPNGLYLLLIVAALCVGCGDRSDDADAPAADVIAGVRPIAYLTERIVGEHLTVDVLAGDRVDPHRVDPTPRQMIAVSQAKLVVLVGLPFERALQRKLLTDNADVTVVDLSTAVAQLPAADTGGHDGEMDPHVWMSPRLAKHMARTLCESLCEIDPDHADAFRANLQLLLGDLDRLDAQLRTTLAPLAGRPILMFHPAFGYFAAEYGLVPVPIETGGKNPGPRHVQRLIDLARREGVKVVFVQPQFSKGIAASIAEQIDATVVTIDPLAHDYIRNLQHIADEIQKALPAATP